jgi:hypothetical protein
MRPSTYCRLARWILVVSLAGPAACSETTDDGGRCGSSSLPCDGSPIARPDVREPGDGGMAPMGADVGSPSGALTVQVEVPQATTPVVVEIATKTSRRMRVVQYPQQYAEAVKHGGAAAGFEGAFSEEFCGKIRALVRPEDPSSSALAKDALKTAVRLRGEKTIHLEVAPFVTQTFRRALERALIDAGATSTVFDLENPMAIRKTRVELVFQPGAMTPVLGSEELRLAIATELEERRQNDPTFPVTGRVDTASSAADFLCDLWAQKAEIRIHWDGDTTSGTTVLTGMKPIF